MKTYSIVVTEFGMDKIDTYTQSIMGWAIWLTTHSKTMRGEDAVLVGRAASSIMASAKSLRARLDRSEWDEKDH